MPAQFHKFYIIILLRSTAELMPALV
jgi:hypothetical protein